MTRRATPAARPTPRRRPAAAPKGTTKTPGRTKPVPPVPARPPLKLDWCSHEAARYAAQQWHYSEGLPSGKAVRVGVWEAEQFIGCVIFSRGANNNLGKPWGLKQTEICELTRVALRAHMAPVSQIVAVALRFLRRHCPGLRLVISYADPAHGHHGGIYQAGGWVYLGSSTPQRELRIAGAFLHKRVASAKWGTASPSKIRERTGLPVEYGPVEWKHTYVMPLDPALRPGLQSRAQPYPKRATGTGAESIETDAPGFRSGEGSVTLTSALHRPPAVAPAPPRVKTLSPNKKGRTR